MGVFLTTRKNTVLRNRIKDDAQILTSLKEGSAGYASMADHIEWQISELREAETVGMRLWGWGFTALICTALLTALSTWLVLDDGWKQLWLLLTIPFTLVFIFGMVDSFAKLPRDEKGNTIRTKKKTD